jgi:hypothetical protein
MDHKKGGCGDQIEKCGSPEATRTPIKIIEKRGVFRTLASGIPEEI